MVDAPAEYNRELSGDTFCNASASRWTLLVRRRPRCQIVETSETRTRDTVFDIEPL